MKKLTYRKQKILNPVQDDRKGLKRLQKTTLSGSSLTDCSTDVSTNYSWIHVNRLYHTLSINQIFVDPTGIEPASQISWIQLHTSDGPTVEILPQTQTRAQAGFIGQALMVLLMVTGIGLGTYLVQQRTNLLPQAAGATVACDTQTLAGQSQQSKGDFTAKYCGAADPNNLCSAAKEGWVSEHEADLKAKNIPCKPGSQTGSTTGSTTGTTGTTTGTTGTNTGTTAGTTGDQTACKSDFTPAYFDAKVANRYARFLAIMKGIPEYCVQADLGVEPALRENSKDGAVSNGRLYLCSGLNSKADALDLVWRVVADSGDLVPHESNRNNPGSDKKNIMEVMASHVTAAEDMLKITDHFAW